MSESGPHTPRGSGRFRTTRWSVVLAARERGSPEARAALSTLCSLYWYPIYAFARRRGMAPDAAQDATQGFFTKLLEKQGLRHVEPEKGRFRSFLLASFKNFLADERAREQAQKRGGGETILSIDVQDAEHRYAREPSHDLTPERIYERRWAMTVIERAVTRLGERYAARGQGALFDRLKEFLVVDAHSTGYGDVASALGMSEIAVRVAVHRLRQRYRTTLVEEIAQTIGGPNDVDEELRHLLSAIEG